MATSCTRRAFLQAVSVLAVSAALVLSGCSSQAGDSSEASKAPPLLTVCVGGSLDVRHAGIVLSETQGLFQKRDLDVSVDELASENDVLEAVQAGESEFGVVSQKTLADAFGCEEPYSVLAIAALEQTKSQKEADGYPLLLIANDTYLVRRAEEALLVVGCVREGYEFACKDQQRAAKSMAKKLQGKTAGDIQAQLEQDASLFTTPSGKWGVIDQDIWDGYFERMHAKGSIANKIPAHHGYSMDYLDESA